MVSCCPKGNYPVSFKTNCPAMKKLYRILLMTFMILVSGVLHAQSSCGAGYSQAQINWDNLDYYFNSGVNTAPYGFSTGNFVTNAMEQSHTFVLGTTDATFALSAAGIAK